MPKELIAKCGAKTGADGKPFKSVQGVRGHEGRCDKCRELGAQKKGQSGTHGASTQQPKDKASKDYYRPLTAKEKELHDKDGRRLGDQYEAICDKTGDLI